MNKLTNGKLRIKGRALAVYLAVAAVGAWFFFYYNRAFGLAFSTALLFAPIASCFATLIPVFKIHAGIEFSHGTADKGEDVRITLTVKSDGWLPLPFLYVSFNNEWLLRPGGDADEHVISVSKKLPGVIIKSYKAEVWGTARLGVSKFAAYDYLGLFKITFEQPDKMPSASVSIRPAVPSSRKNEYLAYIISAMVSDEKEDGRSMDRSVLEQPGFEHRAYVPGDPLKRVNWKLSARLDKLMVRENEFLKTQVPVIILDRVGLRHSAPPEWHKAAALFEERVVEAVLAMLSSMVKQAISCTVYYYFNGAWQTVTVDGADHIMALRSIFSQYAFEQPVEQRVPDAAIGRGGMAAVFTCAFDETLKNAVSDARAGGADISVISPETLAANFGPLWLISESYDFYG